MIATAAPHLWLRIALLATGLVALLPVARAISTIKNEYAVFRTSNHVVPRPPVDPELPAITDLKVAVPGQPPLAAWYIPSRNGAAIMLVHGSLGDRTSLWPEARALAAAGFGVMLVDLPGHGESEGPVDWGDGGRAALSAAFTSLLAQPGIDPNRVGALGLSMGAMLAVQVASVDQRIRALLLSGCFSDAHRQTLFEYRSWGPITGWPAVWTYRIAGFDDSDQRPIDIIARVSPRPLLIVQGTEDGIVPPEMASELYAAAGPPRELWLVPGAGHGDIMRAEPELWPERLVGFFAQALPPTD